MEVFIRWKFFSQKGGGGLRLIPAVTFPGNKKTETATNKSSHCSPPRHLDHKASVLHIVQLALPWLLKEEFYGGMGWDGTVVSWCHSCCCLVVYLRYVCWKNAHHDVEGGSRPHLWSQFAVDRTSRLDFEDCHHFYLQIRTGFFKGPRKKRLTSEYIQQNIAKHCCFFLGGGGMVIQVSRKTPQPHCQPWPKVTEPLPSSSISWYAACRYGSTLGISRSSLEIALNWCGGGTFKKRPWWEKGLRSTSKGVDTGVQVTGVRFESWILPEIPWIDWIHDTGPMGKIRLTSWYGKDLIDHIPCLKHPKW